MEFLVKTRLAFTCYRPTLRIQEGWIEKTKCLIHKISIETGCYPATVFETKAMMEIQNTDFVYLGHQDASVASPSRVRLHSGTL